MGIIHITATKNDHDLHPKPTPRQPRHRTPGSSCRSGESYGLKVLNYGSGSRAVVENKVSPCMNQDSDYREIRLDSGRCPMRTSDDPECFNKFPSSHQPHRQQHQRPYHPHMDSMANAVAYRFWKADASPIPVVWLSHACALDTLDDEVQAPVERVELPPD